MSVSVAADVCHGIGLRESASNSLELAKRAVGLQHLAERNQSAHLAAIANAVVADAANENGMDAAVRGMSRNRALTRAADVCQKANMCDTPDGLQRRIYLEHLADRDDALGRVGAVAPKVKPTELVIAHAASKGHKCASVSAAMGC